MWPSLKTVDSCRVFLTFPDEPFQNSKPTPTMAPPPKSELSLGHHLEAWGYGTLLICVLWDVRLIWIYNLMPSKAQRFLRGPVCCSWEEARRVIQFPSSPLQFSAATRPSWMLSPLVKRHHRVPSNGVPDPEEGSGMWRLKRPREQIVFLHAKQWTEWQCLQKTMLTWCGDQHFTREELCEPGWI